MFTLSKINDEMFTLSSNINDEMFTLSSCLFHVV